MQTVAQFRQTLNRLTRAYPGLVRDARQDPEPADGSPNG